MGVPSWYLIFVPYKIGQANVSMLIPLLILSLGGSGGEVGLAAMLFSLVSMLASIMWGRISDAYEVRKPFIVLGFMGLTLCCGLLYFVTDSLVIIVVYSLTAILVAAEPPITPVYLLRLSRKEEWEDAIGRFNELCGWAWVAGLGIGAVLATSVDLHIISALMAACVFVSVAAALTRLYDVPVYINRRGIRIFFTQVVERRRFVPNIILHMPRWPSFRKDNNRLFFTGIVLLFTGSSLLYLPIIPFLRDEGISTGLIFAVTILNSLGSAVLYRYLGAEVRRKGALAMLRRGIAFRSLLVVLMMAATMVAPWHIVIVAVAFTLVGVSWPFIYISSISFVTRSSDEHRQCTLMGIYNFVSTCGLMVGSLAGGYIYEYISFSAVMVLALVFLAIAYAVLRGVHALVPSQQVGLTPT
ncbi:MAG TPA: MFS transporter [Methanomicrobia archaeon]|nr:MFS transporter [Methanomicrobia archaeon]